MNPRSCPTLIATLLFALSGLLACQPRGTEMKLSKDSQTHAVGRFLIDLPKEVKIEGYSQREQGYGYITVVPGVERHRFHDSIRKRVEELKAQPYRRGGSLLYREHWHKGVDCVDLFYWSGRATEEHALEDDPEELTHESYFLRGGNTYYVEFPHQEKQDVEFRIGATVRVFSRIQARRPDEIPEEPGFCFDRGFIPGIPAPGRVEETRLSFSLRGHPDVSIRLWISTNGEVMDEPILERDRVGERMLPTPGKSYIRARARDVGTLKGQELVRSFKEQNGCIGYSATWEYLGESKNVLAPSVELTIMTGDGEDGEAVDSSLSEKDLFILFDRLVNSIRFRTPEAARAVNAAKAGKPAAPAHQTPLGTQQSSGTRCPEAGIWECAHSWNLGGSTRTFKVGEEFPPAVLEVKRSLLSRIKGEPSEETKSTQWTLVSYP